MTESYDRFVTGILTGMAYYYAFDMWTNRSPGTPHRSVGEHSEEINAMTLPITKHRPDWWVRYASAELQMIRSSFGESAIIAGGAARDYEMNKKPRDIDIFLIKEESSRPFTTLEYALVQPRENSSFTDENGNRDIAHIDSTYIKTEQCPDYESHVKFNLIVIKNNFIEFRSNSWPDKRVEFADNLLNTFDFGINKIAITDIYRNLNDEWQTRQVRHSDFERDLHGRSLTIRLDDFVKYNNIKRLPFRSQKIYSLFPHKRIEILNR